MRVKVDAGRLVRALRLVKSEVKKPEAEIVNKALKDVGFRAMQYTRFAETGLIQAQLYRDKMLLKIAAKRLAQRAGTSKLNRYGSEKLTKTGRVQKFSKVTQQQINREAEKILRRAIASSRAIRAGWIPGLKKVGAQVRGAGRLKSGGTAAKGTGDKATISKLSGYIQNALVTRARMSGRSTPVQGIQMAVQALNKAIAEVSTDREDYARKKMIQRVLRKHSSK